MLLVAANATSKILSTHQLSCTTAGHRLKNIETPQNTSKSNNNVFGRHDDTNIIFETNDNETFFQHFLNCFSILKHTCKISYGIKHFYLNTRLVPCISHTFFLYNSV